MTTTCPILDKKYEDLLSSLYCRSKKERGLQRATKLHTFLEEPAFTYPVIHIGGTNGKGSTATKIAHALTHSGKKVGLLTSPHITSFRERIQINGEMISKEEVLAIYATIEKAFTSLDLNPTFFEINTLMAFCHFAKRKVDCAVIEVGMGGRFDATNIVRPILTVITSLALDHTAYLGDTLDEIAYQKGGIIKKDVPLVLGQSAANNQILLQLAKEIAVHPIYGPFSHYEEENQAIAKQALTLLEVDQVSIEQGILKRPPCRFEVIEKEIPVVFDVAHNPKGVTALIERLRYEFPNRGYRFVIGLSEDKNLEEILSCFPKMPIHLTESPHRAAKASQLAEILNTLGHTSVKFDQDPISAYEQAKQNNEVLVITGTFYMMDHIMPFIKNKDTK